GSAAGGGHRQHRVVAGGGAVGVRDQAAEARPAVGALRRSQGVGRRRGAGDVGGVALPLVAERRGSGGGHGEGGGGSGRHGDAGRLAGDGRRRAGGAGDGHVVGAVGGGGRRQSEHLHARLAVGPVIEFPILSVQGFIQGRF